MSDPKQLNSQFPDRRTTDTIPPEFFDDLYRRNPDPWSFQTSDYEAKKYDETLAILPNARYRNAFEVGCSIGVLTKRLAERCDSLLAIDCSPIALEHASARCEQQGHVRFEKMNVPRQYPRASSFDLVVLSEVAYYWSWRDLRWAFNRIVEQLQPGGHLLLVHWAPSGPGKPLTGTEVHGAFLDWADPALHHVVGRHQGPYWIDLYERSGKRSGVAISRYSTIRNKADGDSTNPQEW